MRLLLDTNVFLWSANEPRRLGTCREAIEDRGNDLLISTVVAWEIAIKYVIGRLPLHEEPAVFVPKHTVRLEARPVAISDEHALGVATLPLLHRDPFDRLLVIQARQLGATLVTSDAVLARYDVETLLV